MKIQDNYKCGLHFAGTTSNLTIIDVWLYNNAKWDSTNNICWSDGNIYSNADNTYISHCRSEYTMGHAYKVCDGANTPIIEWSIAKEFGWWTNDYPATNYYSHHASGFDLPNGIGATVQSNCVVRYNIADTGLYYGIYLRPYFYGGHRVHHNEVMNTPHFDDLPGCLPDNAYYSSQVLLDTCWGGGRIYDNYIHDSGDEITADIQVTYCCTNAVNVYNNRVVSNFAGFYENSENLTNLNIFNNTFITANNSSNSIITLHGGFVRFTNNIVYQSGTAAILRSTVNKRGYNILYAPNGSIGDTLLAGEINDDPALSADHHLTASSPAVNFGLNLSDYFSTDLDGVIRGSQWDIGAYEYQAPATIAPPFRNRFVPAVP